MSIDDPGSRQHCDGRPETHGDSLRVAACHSNDTALVQGASGPYSVPRGTPIAETLPAEVLSECLRASKSLLTRVHASHVSRRWRTVALGDPRLWNRFSCVDLDAYADIARAEEQLCAMLQRSRPLLFHVRIPYQGAWYFVDALLPNVHRLATYDGPVDSFVDLNPKELPLPNLTSLKILDPWCGDTDIVIAAPQWSSRCLPNLRHLTGPVMIFPPWCEPFIALKTLSCHMLYGWSADEWRLALFPNLVCLELRNAAAAGASFFIPFPESLSSLVLRADTGAPRWMANFDAALNLPEIQRLSFILLDGARSLQEPLIRLLSLHRCPIEATLTSDTGVVRFTSIPEDDFVWVIALASGIAFRLRPLEAVCGTRLTVIGIAMEHVVEFLTHKLILPGLVEMRFFLTGALGNALPATSDERLCVHTPRLEELILEIEGSHDEIYSHMEDTKSLLGLLRRAFRTLIVYDAELLNLLALLCPKPFVQELDCGSLAQFAKEYIVDTEE